MNDVPGVPSGESLLTRLHAEAETAQRERAIELVPTLFTRVDGCEGQLREFEKKLNDLEQRSTSRSRAEAREKIWYFLPLAAVIAFTIYVVSQGWADKPSVSITYNVGEIIGGTLVGVGALIAGSAYAFRRVRRE
jgi:hypothetical protein